MRSGANSSRAAGPDRPSVHLVCTGCGIHHGNRGAERSCQISKSGLS
jgi:hypothetical protein